MGSSCSLKLQPGSTTHLVVAPDHDAAPGSVPFTDKVCAGEGASAALLGFGVGLGILLNQWGADGKVLQNGAVCVC
jgi:hypothetical protein